MGIEPPTSKRSASKRRPSLLRAAPDAGSSGEATEARVSAPTRRSVSARFRGIRLALVALDGASILIALVMVRLIRSGRAPVTEELLIGLAAALLIWLGVLHALGLYGIHHLSGLEEFRRIISATGVGVLLITVAGIWWDESFEPVWLGVTWLIVVLFELSARRVVRWHVRRLRQEGPLSLRTLLVGTNDEARRLADVLSPSLGFAPIGFVDTSDGETTPNGAFPVLGRLDELERTIRGHTADCVFVASGSLSSGEVLDIYRACRRTGAEMRISANLPHLLTTRLTVQPIGKVMAVSVRPARLSGTQAFIKRSFDLAMALLGIVATLPLMLLIALAIRLTSRGPVLFLQKRVTQGGRAFTMYKFRTMIPDADGGGKIPRADLTRPFFKLRDDPRLTRVGRLLRPFSLDELPQLWNVVRGEMSLVGPRPLRAEQVAADPEYMAPRHEMKAGLTGWWQVHGRNDLSYEEAIQLDFFYVENWSLSLDLYILLKTVGAILRRQGAY